MAQKSFTFGGEITCTFGSTCCTKKREFAKPSYYIFLWKGVMNMFVMVVSREIPPKKKNDTPGAARFLLVFFWVNFAGSKSVMSHPWSSTVRPWKMMVRRRVSFRGWYIFRGELLNFRWVLNTRQQMGNRLVVYHHLQTRWKKITGFIGPKETPSQTFASSGTAFLNPFPHVKMPTVLMTPPSPKTWKTWRFQPDLFPQLGPKANDSKICWFFVFLLSAPDRTNQSNSENEIRRPCLRLTNHGKTRGEQWYLKFTPLPSNNHQDDYIFNRDSRTKHLVATGLLGGSFWHSMKSWFMTGVLMSWLMN